MSRFRLDCCLSRTARLDYHTFTLLSTLFYRIFPPLIAARDSQVVLMVIFSGARRFAQAALVKSRTSWLFFLFTFAPQSSKVSPTEFNSDDGHSVRCCGDLLQRVAGGARLRRYSVPITVLSRAPKLLVSGRRCRVRPISRCGYITMLQMAVSYEAAQAVN